MANAARVHAVERGKDPAPLPLFAFGGAGPVHGYRVARDSRLPALIVAVRGGGALGVRLPGRAAGLRLRAQRVRPHGRLDWAARQRLLARDGAKRGEGAEGSGLRGEEIATGAPPTCATLARATKCRWRCRTARRAPRWRCIAAAFEEVYRGALRPQGPDVPLEVINWRVVASGPRPEMNLKLPRDARQAGAMRVKGPRPAYFPERGGFVETAVYDRYALGPATEFAARRSSRSASRP